MGLLSEPEVIRFRHDHYHLLMRLLAGEPDAQLVATLQEALPERSAAAGQVHELMGEGWRRMAEHLNGNAREALADEFTRVFLGPVGDLVHPYESFYLTGRLYGEPLARVRAFARRLGLEANGTRSEPEDGLDFELGIMAQLIARQEVGGDVDLAALLEPQREFLAQHLLVWGAACAADLESHPAAAFYRGVGTLLRGFLEVERDFFVQEGGLKVQSLAEARGRYKG
ncbi:MAG TPA: molecular chaperone TorD family protein, partial [bacterium]|nr:molecular chaperone TorD family protein [bacterium]